MIWIAGCAGALVAAAAAPMVARYAGERRLRRRCSRLRTLVLTYDDGPSGDLTVRILDLLRDQGAVATFFVLGTRVRASPREAERAVAEGHEIGCHSDRHAHPWRSWPWAAAKDVGDGFRELRGRWPGVRLYRPPHGKMTPFTWLAAAAAGARFGWWTVDSGDWRDVLPEPRDVVAAVARDGGGVVLLHDYGGDPRRASVVLETTRALLEWARSSGVRVATLGSLLDTEEPDGSGARGP